MFRRKSSLFLLLLFTGILLFSAACGTSTNANNGTSSAPASNPSDVSPPTGNNSPGNSAPGNLTTTTACPASDHGRPAVMPALQLGKDRTIVFSKNIPLDTNNPSFTLQRYDVETGKTATILSQDGVNIYNIQLSGDGQWILFSAQTSSSSRMQLVRIDGKYLQTLYCAPQGQQIDPRNGAEGGYSHGVQWSPDQKQVIFTQGKTATLAPSPLLYLLNVASGKVQIALATTSDTMYIEPQTWVDNTRVYVTGSSISLPHPPATLLLLDTSKGAQQKADDLQIVLGVEDTLWDADSTYDASKLFVVRFDPTPGRAGPGTFCEISSMPAIGQSGKTIFHSDKLVVSSLRVLGYGSSSLLLSVNQSGSPADQNNGIWKIQTDGTGLTRLTTNPGPFNLFSQYPWANVARDGSLYMVNTFFGSVNGGSVTHYTSEDGALPVGWTTF